MIQRQPRDEDIDVVVERRRYLDRVEVRAQHALRQHDAFGLGGRSARELQDRQPVEIVGDALIRIGTRPTLARHEIGQQHRRRIALDRLVERREIRVEQKQRRVGVSDPGPRLLDELFDRPHPHREGQHYCARSGEPARLDRSDERSARRPEDRNVVAGLDAPGLHPRRDHPRVVVQLRPRHQGAFVLADERRPVPPVGHALEARDKGREGHGHKTCARRGPVTNHCRVCAGSAGNLKSHVPERRSDRSGARDQER